MNKQISSELIWVVLKTQMSGRLPSGSTEPHGIHLSSWMVLLRWSLTVVPLGPHNSFTPCLLHPGVRSHHSHRHVSTSYSYFSKIQDGHRKFPPPPNARNLERTRLKEVFSPRRHPVESEATVLPVLCLLRVTIQKPKSPSIWFKRNPQLH